ncbi:MAG: hypothetical protein ACOYON_02055 [Fimbriimonas sp.]
MQAARMAILPIALLVLAGCDRIEISDRQKQRGKIRRTAETYDRLSEEATVLGLRFRGSDTRRSQTYTDPFWKSLDEKVDQLRRRDQSPKWVSEVKPELALTTFAPIREELISLLQNRPLTDSNGMDPSAASNTLAANFFISRTSEGLLRHAHRRGEVGTVLRYLRLCRLCIDGAPDPLNFGMQIRLVSMEEGYQLSLRDAINRIQDPGALKEIGEFIRSKRVRSLHDVMEGDLQDGFQLYDPDDSSNEIITQDIALNLQVPEAFIDVPELEARRAICARQLDRAIQFHKLLQDSAPTTPAELRAVIQREKAELEKADNPADALELGRIPVWMDYADLWERTQASVALTLATLECKQAYLREKSWPTTSNVTNPASGRPFTLSLASGNLKIEGEGVRPSRTTGFNRLQTVLNP